MTNPQPSCGEKSDSFAARGSHGGWNTGHTKVKQASLSGLAFQSGSEWNRGTEYRNHNGQSTSIMALSRQEIHFQESSHCPKRNIIEHSKKSK